jgi:ribosomal protein S18 acetylase RimI-like enzyme
VSDRVARAGGPTVRWMVRRDLPEVLAAQEGSRGPLNEKAFLRELRDDNVICKVAELDYDRVLGVCVYTLRRHYYVLTHLAVHPEFRRQGVALGLLGHLTAKLRHDGRALVQAAVPEGRGYLPLHLTLKAAGFRGEDVADGVIDFAYRLRPAATPAEEGQHAHR